MMIPTKPEPIYFPRNIIVLHEFPDDLVSVSSVAYFLNFFDTWSFGPEGKREFNAFLRRCVGRKFCNRPEVLLARLDHAAEQVFASPVTPRGFVGDINADGALGVLNRSFFNNACTFVGALPPPEYCEICF